MAGGERCITWKNNILPGHLFLSAKASSNNRLQQTTASLGDCAEELISKWHNLLELGRTLFYETPLARYTLDYTHTVQLQSSHIDDQNKNVAHSLKVRLPESKPG